MNDNSNDETNFPLNLLSTDTQVLRFFKIFANDSSPSTKLWKTQLSKMVQLGGFITSILPFLTISGKLLAKNVLLLLSVTAAALATDTAIPKKIMDRHDYFDIISNEEMKGT